MAPGQPDRDRERRNEEESARKYQLTCNFSSNRDTLPNRYVIPDRSPYIQPDHSPVALNSYKVDYTNKSPPSKGAGNSPISKVSPKRAAAHKIKCKSQKYKLGSSKVYPHIDITHDSPSHRSLSHELKILDLNSDEKDMVQGIPASLPCNDHDRAASPQELCSLPSLSSFSSFSSISVASHTSHHEETEEEHKTMEAAGMVQVFQDSVMTENKDSYDAPMTLDLTTSTERDSRRRCRRLHPRRNSIFILRPGHEAPSHGTAI